MTQPESDVRKRLAALICGGKWELPCVKEPGHDGACGPRDRAPLPRVQDERSSHSFPVTVSEERCRCGAPAAHKLGESTGPDNFHPLTAYVCCQHFSSLIGPCGEYPYDFDFRL